MAEATSAIPVGVYPYLTVTGAKAAIEFYSRAFGADEEFRSYGEAGVRIMHARLRINGMAVLLSDYFAEFHGGADAPAPAGVMVHLEVDDADGWFKRASEAGAKVKLPLQDMFWGEGSRPSDGPFRSHLVDRRPRKT